MHLFGTHSPDQLSYTITPEQENPTMTDCIGSIISYTLRNGITHFPELIGLHAQSAYGTAYGDGANELCQLD